jgi:hypothetical protein
MGMPVGQTEGGERSPPAIESGSKGGRSDNSIRSPRQLQREEESGRGEGRAECSSPGAIPPGRLGPTMGRKEGEEPPRVGRAAQPNALEPRGVREWGSEARGPAHDVCGRWYVAAADRSPGKREVAPVHRARVQEKRKGEGASARRGGWAPAWARRPKHRAPWHPAKPPPIDCARRPLHSGPAPLRVAREAGKWRGSP